MKNSTVRITAVVFAYLLAALVCQADAASYAHIIKERDSVLSAILADRESKRSSGTADQDAIDAAQLALYSFRRDVAKSEDEKIKNQELIIRIFEAKLEGVKGKVRAGVAENIHVLEARAALVEAMQVLEELRMNEDQG